MAETTTLYAAARGMLAALESLEGWDHEFGSRSIAGAVWTARDDLAAALDTEGPQAPTPTSSAVLDAGEEPRKSSAEAFGTNADGIVGGDGWLQGAGEEPRGEQCGEADPWPGSSGLRCPLPKGHDAPHEYTERASASDLQTRLAAAERKIVQLREPLRKWQGFFSAGYLAGQPFESTAAIIFNEAAAALSGSSETPRGGSDV